MLPLSVVMLGATGAVGSRTAAHLAKMPNLERLTLLGRRPLEEVSGPKVHQHSIDVHDVGSYEHLLLGHTSAICTLGVGEPSKMDRETFVTIDKDVPLAFGAACKRAGVRHFELLSSVGADSGSRIWYLRTKGELIDALAALAFERLSIFEPSMILTPKNRYGLAQAVTLRVWPVLKPLLVGGLRPYRGIRVDALGEAIANNTQKGPAGVEHLRWDEIETLAEESS